MKQNNKKFNNAMHKFVGVLDKYDLSGSDSDDDFRPGCPNVSQCHHRESFSGLHLPGRSYVTNPCFSQNQLVHCSISLALISSVRVETGIIPHTERFYNTQGNCMVLILTVCSMIILSG